jgi:replicative DNA helicase
VDCDKELCDLAAERAVIAGVIRYGVEAFIDIDGLVTDRSFTAVPNQILFKCLRHLFGQDPDAKPDIPTILSAAKAIGLDDQLASPEEKKYLRAVTLFPVEKENVRKLAGKVAKLEVARDGLLVAEQIKAGLHAVTGDESIAEIKSRIETPPMEFVLSLSNAEGDAGPKRLGEDAVLWLEHIIANPVSHVGIPTQFEKWNEAVGGGLRPGVHVFGMRPKSGKTTTCVAMARHIAKVVGDPALVCDTEMTKEDHLVLNLAALSRVPRRAIEKGDFAGDVGYLPRVRAAADELQGLPYDFLSISGKPFDETLAYMRRWVMTRVGLDAASGKAKRCVIFFDYLKLMDASGLTKDLKEYQLLGFMMTALHDFALRYGVPIVLFIQLNRDGIDVENSSAASGSDRIIWLCHTFTIGKKLTDEEMANQAGRDEKYNRKFIVSECRHGPGLDPGDFIYIKGEFDVGIITEGPTRFEHENSDPNAGFQTEQEKPRGRGRKNKDEATIEFGN